jgi:hypothetical protein
MEDKMKHIVLCIAIDREHIGRPFLLRKHSFPKEQDLEEKMLLLIRPCECHPLHISRAPSTEEALGVLVTE